MGCGYRADGVCVHGCVAGEQYRSTTVSVWWIACVGGCTRVQPAVRPDSGLVQPRAYAMRVGRTECLWQRPRPRRWNFFGAALLHCRALGTLKKAPSSVQRGDSLTGPLLPWSQAGYMEQEEAGASFTDVPGRDTGHAGRSCGLRPAGSVKTISTSWLHGEPMKRP